MNAFKKLKEENFKVLTTEERICINGGNRSRNSCINTYSNCLRSCRLVPLSSYSRCLNRCEVEVIICSDIGLQI